MYVSLCSYTLHEKVLPWGEEKEKSGGEIAKSEERLPLPPGEKSGVR